MVRWIVRGVACVWSVVMVATILWSAYTAGQSSVRRAAYVERYPATASSWGPYMGDCLRTREAIYCAQER